MVRFKKFETEEEAQQFMREKYPKPAQRNRIFVCFIRNYFYVMSMISDNCQHKSSLLGGVKLLGVTPSKILNYDALVRIDT